MFSTVYWTILLSKLGNGASVTKCLCTNTVLNTLLLRIFARRPQVFPPCILLRFTLSHLVSDGKNYKCIKVILLWNDSHSFDIYHLGSCKLSPCDQIVSFGPTLAPSFRSFLFSYSNLFFFTVSLSNDLKHSTFPSATQGCHSTCCQDTRHSVR